MSERRHRDECIGWAAAIIRRRRPTPAAARAAAIDRLVDQLGRTGASLAARAELRTALELAAPLPIAMLWNLDQAGVIRLDSTAPLGWRAALDGAPAHESGAAILAHGLGMSLRQYRDRLLCLVNHPEHRTSGERLADGWPRGCAA